MRYVILMLLASAANAEGFYIEGGVAMLLKHNKQAERLVQNCVPFNTRDGVVQCNMTTTYASPMRDYEINQVRNPYGDFALGYDWSFKKITFDVQALHESALSTGDRGQESFRFSVKWYPFHQ